ncbi:MAG: polyprenyl synthetase family protein [Bernardetiaceae bacterium]
MPHDLLQQALASLTYTKPPEDLYAPIDYILRLGGKRMRPLLCLMSYQLFKDDPQTILRPALATEVFHNFTLLHDDIMDKAPLRRGQPTAHEKWDTNTALLSGDVMLVKAYDLLLDVPDHQLREVLLRFNRCATEVCEGQQYDMSFEERDAVSLDEYIQMIRLKTAVLLGFALRLGGILADAQTDTCHQLDALGVAAGIGFQIQDDLLDVYADPQKFGKQVGGDILENKKTYLRLTAQSLADAPTLAALQADYPTPAQKIQAVREIYDRLGVREQATAAMQGYFREAFGILDRIPVAKARKEALHHLLHQLSQRDH